MNKVQKKILALQLARKLIETEQEHFICFALSSVWSGRPDLTEAAWELKRYIMRQLAPRETLREWQQDHRPELNRAKVTGEIREDRLAWIDWMIAELEKKL